jgi:hypothetical protein
MTRMNPRRLVARATLPVMLLLAAQAALSPLRAAEPASYGPCMDHVWRMYNECLVSTGGSWVCEINFLLYMAACSVFEREAA